MEINIASQSIIKKETNGSQAIEKRPPSQIINGIERIWVAVRVRFTILIIAWKCYGSLLKAIKTTISLGKFKTAVYGKNQLRRCVKLNNKYYFGIYIPAFPSPVFNRYVQTELNKIQAHHKPVNRLQVLQLAITSSCPMKCEHCFEWKNLNQPGTFTTEELKILIDKFQQDGCAQFHLTGGEPMIKMERIKELVSPAEKTSEFYILSSGLNLTAANAKLLKESGVTGVIVSLDHFDPAIHNIFRGSAHAFDYAINAVRFAQNAGLLTAFSICVTRSFVSKQNLLKYAELARDCGVAFIQLLEPKPVGHYEGKAITLGKEQINLLEKFYLAANFEKKFREYPVIIYHGFHQRRIGCMSGGDRLLYIDSAGNVNACPFCQTKNFHAGKIISGDISIKDISIGGCPVY